MMRRGRTQAGYALLVVLFFGAVMAITMAVSLPRAAFESQRDKEDDLIYRGSQFSRAVGLYFRKFKRYPAKLEDLEKTNNVRFLRRKYVDPITKKDEWRFIHIGPAGVFTDSLLYDKPKKKEGDPDTPGVAAAGAATDPSQGPPITGMADRLRANIVQGQITGPGPEQFPPGAVPPDASQPQPQQQQYFNLGQTVGIPGAGAAASPLGPVPFIGGPGSGPRPPGLPAGVPFGSPQQPGVFGQQASPFVQQQPGVFGQQPQNPQAMQNVGRSAFTGTPGLGNEAARIIGQLLTTPRPGGLAGIQGQAQGSLFGTPAGGAAAGGGAVFGGGIAGVASKSEARGIKVYNERETYNEWEFVYDYRKDPVLMGAGMQGVGVPGLGGQPLGTQPGAAFGQPAMMGQPGIMGQPGVFGQPAGTVTPINPAQPGLPGSPFGVPGGGRPTTIITPGAPPRR
jgi:hypothetical protein